MQLCGGALKQTPRREGKSAPPDPTLLDVATLTRAAYLVAYLAVTLALGVFALAGWWLFAAVVLEEFGCDGLGGPCGSIGRFTSDNWWVIVLVVAVFSGLALFPLYRRLRIQSE